MAGPSDGLATRLKDGLPHPLWVAQRNLREMAHARWPRALSYWALARSAKDPISFNEKLRYRMCFDRRPLLTQFADKVAVRDYVRATVGERYLTRSFGVFDSPSDLPWSDLPREFVCKASHGSGASVLVWDGAPGGALPKRQSRTTWERFLVRPGDLDRDDFTRLCSRWLSLNFECSPGHPPEWAYRDIPPQLLVEELLLEPDGSLPKDYKFFAFDGRCEFVQVDYSRFDGHRRDLFTPDWEPLPVTFEYPRPDVSAPRPATLGEMRGVAEALGTGVDFVRVDLYSVGDRVVFGELTNYPEAGQGRFWPETFDLSLGSVWRLPGVDVPAEGMLGGTGST